MLIRSPSLMTIEPTRTVLAAGVDVQLLGAADAGLAHAAGDHRGVRGLAAAGGEDAVGGDHALEVVGVGLPADQHHLLAARRPRPPRSAESKTTRPTAAPGEAAMPWVSSSRSADRSNCGNISCASWAPVTRDSASSRVISCSSTSCVAIRNAAAGGALADPGLQHPQLAALDGELDVAQVAVVGLQPAHHLGQLLVRVRVDGRPGRPGSACCGCRRRRPRPARWPGSRRRRRACPDAGSRVKATPVPLVSPRLPNTMVQMLTAVPRSCGIRSRRRYSRARSVFQELKTARIAMSSCSRGCCGNSGPECSRIASLNVVDQRLQVVDVQFEVADDALGRTSPCPARRRTPRRACPARSCRTSAAAGGRNPRRTARRR